MFNTGLSLSLRKQRPLAVWKGILDLLSSPTEAATDLQLLTKKYTGPLVRVRRAVDNAEQDFYPTTKVGMTARYIRVQRNGISNFAEIKAMASGLNVALGKPVLASSARVGYGEFAAYLTDGNTVSVWHSDTSATGEQWVQVDLGAPTLIQQVIVTPRALDTGYYIGGAKVYVSMQPMGTATIAQLDAGAQGAARVGTMPLTSSVDQVFSCGTEKWVDTSAISTFVGGENLFTYSAGFATGWTLRAGTTAVDNAATAPDSTQTASRVTTNGTWDGLIYKNNSGFSASGQVRYVTVWARLVSGSCSISASFYDTGSAISVSPVAAQTITATWTKFVFSGTSAGAATNSGSVGFAIAGNGVVDVWHPQRTNDFEKAYIETAATVISGNGFVTKLYDQTGKGNHAVQANVAYQPKLISAGLLNTINGRPAINTTSGYLHYSGQTMTVQQIFSVANAATSMTYCGLVQFRSSSSFSNPPNQNSGFGVAIAVGGTAPVGLCGGFVSQQTSKFTLSGADLTTAFNSPSNNAQATLNVPFTALAQFVAAGTGAGWGTIGTDSYASTGRNWAGSIGPVILHASNLSAADRQLLERKAGAAYGISVV